MLRRGPLLLIVLLSTLAAADPAWDRSGKGAMAWRWSRIPVAASGVGGGPVAVAAHAGEPGRVAVAHEDGVSVRVDGGRFRFAARVRAARDLAFDAAGNLYVASLDGLWHVSTDGRVSDRSPAPGEPARAVHRVVVAPSGVYAGTDAGAFSSEDGRRWQRLSDGLPVGPVTALAVSGGGDALWLVVGEELWRLELPGGRGRRVPIAGAPPGIAPTDLAAGLPGADVAVLYPRAIAVREPGRGSFRLLRPVWPPGAVAGRVAAGAGRLWLATDLGLLSAPALAGPWRRAAPPAGSAAVRSVAAASGDDGMLVASGLGLLRGAPVLRAGVAAAASAAPLAAPAPHRRDPGIRAVHRASLRYLGLEPERMRELREGLAVRGWLPSVSLRVGAARDRSRQRDYDEAFVSGDTRRLRDRQTDRALDLDASLVMTWDLGALAFDPDAIDLSREHRQVVSLRDNVIDEINQLYFERLGLLAQLGPGSELPEPDRRALERRADELAAGLDAWTGGWFSRAEAHPDSGGARED